MVMLKYVKREARPSYKTSNLSQQNIEAAQKSDADALNQQQTNLGGVGGQYLPLLLKGVTCKDRNTYERLIMKSISALTRCCIIFAIGYSSVARPY